MRVLVVYKKSFLESHAADRRVIAQLEPRDRARLLRADLENRRALADVTAHLEKIGVRYDAVFRGSLAERRRYDLIISLGGDGTFFAAARHLRDTPILGINSDPSNSLGLWTCADRKGFRKPLELALGRKLPAARVWRMLVSLNGKPPAERVFNDVLLSHKNPAAMTRYRIEVDGRTEDQKSSGIWIATAAGSTAGIRSAGGSRMPIGSKRLQFVVREPYTWPKPRYRFVRGLASRFRITTFMVNSGIWLDGSRVHYDLALGDHVDIRAGDPLTVLGLDDARRRRLFP
jgi:NAD+ kinase